MLKKLSSLVILIVLVFSNSIILETNAIKIVSPEVYAQQHKEITLSDMFIFFWKLYDSKIPETYKFINLNIKWVDKWTELYDNLQKLVYVDIIKNSDIELNKYKVINAYSFYVFAEKNYDINFINDADIKELKSRNAIFKDFERITNKLTINKNTFELDVESNSIKQDKEIFKNVYNTLTKNHYSRDTIDRKKMITEATKALADATGDKYTVYFPPVDNKNFNEALTWEYQGIWAYVDMEKPWEFKIVTPIPWSPAEKSWLKGWDLVLKVDWVEIKENHSVTEVVSWIKWPAWTEVVLTIKRLDKIFDVKVIRDTIIIKEIESKKINNNTLYIQMKFFWPRISEEFTQSLEILKTDKNIKKIIFDLRSNWGWYLWEVSNILWHFVPKWEATAKVKYYSSTQNYFSRWYDDIDFSKYKLVVLENWWTASASEIFIWTLKDYFPDTTIIWEQSYWKWSVQTIRSFSDGSSLKYTIAKWYTWKNEIWIDWVWITPDILIKMEKYWVDKKDDAQLQKAIKLR